MDTFITHVFFLDPCRPSPLKTSSFWGGGEILVLGGGGSADFTFMGGDFSENNLLASLFFLWGYF